MNIVFVANITNEQFKGPNNSVPASVISQSKYDDVLLLNIFSNYIVPKELNKISYDKIDWNFKFSNLNKPFNKPDLVIFESIYNPIYVKIAKECKINGIPYILIPRSSLTKQAQNYKKLKKIVGNLIMFNKFIKEANAIHYLTNQEYKDSGKQWNTNNIIIPNGVDSKNATKEFNTDKLVGVFIGRPNIYQKGLDLLIESCSNIKSLLIENSVQITIYAPGTGNDKTKIQELIDKADINTIIKLDNPLFGKEKEQCLLKSDFFILTSRFEGLSMGMLEALSYGVPCLITEGTNMLKEIEEYDAGWGSETTVEGISGIFKKLIKEKNLLKEKSNNAINLANNYTWDSISKYSHKEYQKIIDF